ncbi:MAG: ATP:cob(I)alamin adenosyltransferase, partial [Odoribacter splanchnicus]
TEVDEAVMKYVNRLSDYLFILARKIAHDSGCEEMKWVPRK